MVRDRDRRKIIWPSYFDIKLSRAAGRRVRKSFSIENPDLEKVTQILKSLNLRFEVENDKKHPARWWKNEGRILVDTSMSKVKLLDAIGNRLKK